jgi:RimJ/RimL family protein N-acetyltransferase
MMGRHGFPKVVELEDGRTACIDFLSKKDNVRELQGFLNALVAEKTYITYDEKITLREEIEWKKKRLREFRKGEGYNLVGRIDGKIAGLSGAHRDRCKARDNICLGISIGKHYRRIGLGEAILRLNISLARKMLKPRNIYLSVFAPNKPAVSLYKKLGFRKFAVYPKWLLHNGRYVDHVFMRLDRKITRA